MRNCRTSFSEEPLDRAEGGARGDFESTEELDGHPMLYLRNDALYVTSLIYRLRSSGSGKKIKRRRETGFRYPRSLVIQPNIIFAFKELVDSFPLRACISNVNF